MARPIWKGYITFGLVNVPVVLYSAEKKSPIQFRMVDMRDKEPIRYIRINESTGKEVPWEKIGKGYEYEESNYVVINEEELKSIAGENSKTINIETFVNRDDINVMELAKPYYLVPDKKGDKGYVILRETLKNTKKIGIAKVIIHTKEYLAALIPYENALVLDLLRYDSELKKPSELELPSDNIKTYKINNKELEVAKQLVNSMSSKWKPDTFHDEYQIALEKWVNEKIHHKKPQSKMKERVVIDKKANVVNFVDLLKKSLHETKPTKKKTAKSVKAVHAKNSHRKRHHAKLH